MLRVLRDENGKMSSTRVTLLVMLTIFTVLLFCGDLAVVPSQVWGIIQSVLLLCLGGTAVRSSIKNAKV